MATAKAQRQKLKGFTELSVKRSSDFQGLLACDPLPNADVRTVRHPEDRGVWLLFGDRADRSSSSNFANELRIVNAIADDCP